MIGWLLLVILELVYPILVRAFYATTKTDGVSISTKLRGIEIMLTREKICEILDIEANGVCGYEIKNWPQIKGFIQG